MDNNKEKLKFLLFEVLRRKLKTQVNTIVNEIQAKLDGNLSEIDEQIILELLHELTTSNILMPGISRYNSGWPWLSVTEHGKNILNKSGPPVYDHDGYFAELKDRVTDIDKIVEIYLSESLKAYQYNLF